MKKIWTMLFLIVVSAGLALALAGCGSRGSPSSQAPTATASTDTQQPTAAPGSEAPATPPSTAPEPAVEGTAVAPSSPASPTTPQDSTVQPVEPVAETPTLDVERDAPFPRSIQALRSLSSYRYATVMKYEGTGDSGTVKILGEYSAPDRYHLTIIDSEEERQSEFVKIGDSLWVYDDGKWTKVPDVAVTAMSQGIFNFALDFVWEALAKGLEEDANLVDKETINGIKTLHYSSTGSEWSKGIGAGFGNARGDIWIAEAGYPVKFVFTASGTDEEGNSGAIEWRTEVTDVNGDISIEPPGG